MALFYPRKQTLVIILVCLAAVGGAAYYAYGSSYSGQASQNDDVVVANEPETPQVLPDTDWQKQFISTSTVGSDKKIASAGQTTPSNAPLSATDLLGQEFFTKYSEMRQAGLTNDPDTVNEVGLQLLSDSVGSVQTPSPYPVSTIRIVAATDQTSLNAYASAITDILNSYVPDRDHNEAVIAEQAFEKGDLTQLKDIETNISLYQEAIVRLKAIPVPKPVAYYHLDLMYGFALALFNAQSLRHADTDPVKAMAAIGNEINALQTMDTAVTSIKQYLSANGITLG